MYNSCLTWTTWGGGGQNDKSASCLNCSSFCLLHRCQVSALISTGETERGRRSSLTLLLEMIIKMEQYKMGRASACCGEPINVYDWAVTFYGFNGKCRQLRLLGGEIKEAQRMKSFASFSGLVWNLEKQVNEYRDPSLTGLFWRHVGPCDFHTILNATELCQHGRLYIHISVWTQRRVWAEDLCCVQHSKRVCSHVVKYNSVNQEKKPLSYRWVVLNQHFLKRPAAHHVEALGSFFYDMHLKKFIYLFIYFPFACPVWFIIRIIV